MGQAGISDTLANLANTIHSTASTTGISASIDAATGKTLTLTALGTGGAQVPTEVGANLTSVTPATTVATTLTGTPTIGDAAYAGTVGTLTLSGTATSGDLLGGSITIGANSITLGTANGANKTNTMANLAQTINNGNFGVQASLDSTGKIMTFTSANTAIKFDS